MYGYIYKITVNNPESSIYGCYYIGQHKINIHNKKYFGSGIIITDYVEKYGTKDLVKEILCECENKEELNNKEIEFIGNLYITDSYLNGGKCLNLKAGGHESGISELTREKHRIASKKHKHSEETKRKLSEMKKGIPCLKNRGKHHSEEWKKHISESNKGRKCTPEHLANIRKAAKNRKYIVSEETRKKISESSKGKKVKPETIEKIKKGLKGIHWWNNGIIQIMAKECPGEEWIPGILSRKPYKIKPYNDGKITVYRKKCPKGFVFGELKEDIEEC